MLERVRHDNKSGSPSFGGQAGPLPATTHSPCQLLGAPPLGVGSYKMIALWASHRKSPQRPGRWGTKWCRQVTPPVWNGSL